jgi:hypothetical protein
MATWKKVAVSGSNISQFVNDKNYLTSVSAQHAFSTASFLSTQMLAGGSNGNLTFASSSASGLKISANAGTDTVTFSLSSVPNSSLANSSVTIGGTAISLGGSSNGPFSGLTLTNLKASGSFSGSFRGNGSGLTGIATTLNINAGTGGPSTVALTSQTLTVAGTSNEVETSVSGQTITVGLPNDVTVSNNLTVGGNLNVQGTITYVNTTDLLVEDKFILLASGSATAGDGGIIIDRGSDGNGNIAYGYDSSTDRWGFQNGIADSSNALDPTSGNGVNGAFVGYVFTEAAHTATKPTTGEFVVAGAVYTSTAGDIWIYS